MSLPELAEDRDIIGAHLPHSATSPASASRTAAIDSNPESPISSSPAPRPLKRSTTGSSLASNASSRLRAASIKLMDADPPPGFMASLGHHGSRAPTLSEIRRSSLSQQRRPEGFNRSGRLEEDIPGRQTGSSIVDSPSPVSRSPDLAVNVPASTNATNIDRNVHGIEKTMNEFDSTNEKDATISESTPSSEYTERPEKKTAAAKPTKHQREVLEPWESPSKLPWTTSTVIALRGFSKWVCTVPGFLITIYGLNVVAWGGMLFLLLCNAAPAMCYPDCNDINSPRRVWVEIDSQILNALFCVTGFGLAPWRFRDLYWWGVWRLSRKPENKSKGIRRLAGIHRGWYRLVGSDALVTGSAQMQDPSNPALPIPLSKAPSDPLTTIRAPPTDPWRMDYVVWCNVSNTFLQAVLSGFMWGLNRYDRPSWSTGLFVALACIAASMGGLMMFQEGKKVKRVEGVEIGLEERRARGWDVENVRGEASAVGLAASEGAVLGEETLAGKKTDGSDQTSGFKKWLGVICC